MKMLLFVFHLSSLLSKLNFSVLIQCNTNDLFRNLIKNRSDFIGLRRASHISIATSRSIFRNRLKLIRQIFNGILVTELRPIIIRTSNSQRNFSDFFFENVSFVQELESEFKKSSKNFKKSTKKVQNFKKVRPEILVLISRCFIKHNICFERTVMIGVVLNHTLLLTELYNFKASPILLMVRSSVSVWS